MAQNRNFERRISAIKRQIGAMEAYNLQMHELLDHNPNLYGEWCALQGAYAFAKVQLQRMRTKRDICNAIDNLGLSSIPTELALVHTRQLYWLGLPGTVNRDVYALHDTPDAVAQAEALYDRLSRRQ